MNTEQHNGYTYLKDCYQWEIQSDHNTLMVFPGRQIPRCHVPLRLIQMQKVPVSDTTIARGEIKRHRSFNKQNKVPFPINHIFEMLCGSTAFHVAHRRLKGTLCIS